MGVSEALLFELGALLVMLALLGALPVGSHCHRSRFICWRG
ncbi:putative membrane protein [Mycobacterium kansasii]|uniref:Putative membrane protein n=1 Tax=Mycobacterium kansasii TaxID=1768 RepID=A0A1V3XR78_MYCKA|nr:putative membrane protein [Mycobacterium kansasii]